MIKEVRVIAPEIGHQPIISVEYDDNTGLCNGSNAVNWNNILNLSGEPGSWSFSFKKDCYADCFEIMES